MYLAVDIGGTKTLVATISDDGIIEQKHRFATPKDYRTLLDELRRAKEHFSVRDFRAGGVGVPGHINYEGGISLNSPHVAWGHVPLRDDCATIFSCPFMIDNDANMAALSEAMLNKDRETVLYFTISTGIGTGLVHRQQLAPVALKSEGGHMILPQSDGKLEIWENFASGSAIVRRYGKKAEEITNQEEWQAIARDLALGFYNHIAMLQPDLIVVGGSIGTHFDHYRQYLLEELKRYEEPLVSIPPIVKAKRPEEAVLFGCYDLAKQRFGNSDG
jgi:predicted NBD/HSP70 family sugar kinase